MNVADALSANLGAGATTTPKAVLATKVVATIGPASEDLETLRAMVAAGMDVARINFSHIRTHDELTRQVGLVRAATAAEGRQVAILGDLCGPKMRLRHVPDGWVRVEPGSVGFGLSDSSGVAARSSSPAWPPSVTSGDTAADPTTTGTRRVPRTKGGSPARLVRLCTASRMYG